MALTFIHNASPSLDEDDVLHLVFVFVTLRNGQTSSQLAMIGNPWSVQKYQITQENPLMLPDTYQQRNKEGEIIFADAPDFRPNLTPREIFLLGSFGGTYWRPIYSTITHASYANEHLQYPASWWKGIPDPMLTSPWEAYDRSLNQYKVKVGTTLAFWEQKEWITEYHPYGWVQWYCDFYLGKRSPDDPRQIKRWIRTAGPKSRFRRALINLIKKKKGAYDTLTISPKIRQTLQHWAYRLTQRDFDTTPPSTGR